jgi:predicted  nucleic acid-binding Zn-ribbon protein
MATPPSPSPALVRTARSEIERIDRGLATIEQRRAALLGQLAELNEEADGYVRRRQLLEELLYIEQVTPSAAITTSSSLPRRAVRGLELRRVAGRLLWSWQRDREINYREWFERTLAEGYAVGGKDPAASFLTNIRDSPAVRRGSKQGRYRLDPHSQERVAQELGEVRAELADLEQTVERAYVDGEQRGVDALRSHRDELKQRLKRLEGKMDELRYIFDENSEELDPDANASTTLQAA